MRRAPAAPRLGLDPAGRLGAVGPDPPAAGGPGPAAGFGLATSWAERRRPLAAGRGTLRLRAATSTLDLLRTAELGGTLALLNVNGAECRR